MNQHTAAGDELLLINLQGDVDDYDRVGTREFVLVKSVGSAIELSAPVRLTYTGVANKPQLVVVQRVPHFESVQLVLCIDISILSLSLSLSLSLFHSLFWVPGLTHPSPLFLFILFILVFKAGSLRGQAWNGLSPDSAQRVATGIVAMRVRGTLTGGAIDVTGCGYRGGCGSNSGYCQYACNGEGVNQVSQAIPLAQHSNTYVHEPQASMVREGPQNVGGGEGMQNSAHGLNSKLI